jgi:uncharacterized coiled-coil protein SlyX
MKDINEMIVDKIASVEDDIATLYKRISEKRRQIEEIPTKLTQMAEVVKKLNEAGFPCDISFWSDMIYVETSQDKLTALHKVIGRMKYLYKDVKDPRKKLVEVTLSSVRHPFINVKYVKKLPNGAKCRIVTTKHKAYTSYGLVCDSNN